MVEILNKIHRTLHLLIKEFMVGLIREYQGYILKFAKASIL